MSPDQQCPTRQELEHFVLGRLEQETATRIGDHVATCDLCAGTVSNLQYSEETLSCAQPIGDDIEQDPLAQQTGTVALPLAERDDPMFDDTPPQIAGIAPPNLPGDQQSWPFLSPSDREGDLGKLGPYHVLSVLGVGGMGVVFRAEDPKLHRQIALKAIKPEFVEHEDAKQRFMREAQAVAAINHDNVIAIYQVAEDRVPFLTMPLLEGETLAERLRRSQPLPVDQVLEIAHQMAVGLDAAHQRGVVHRDIKPTNIWLEQDSDRVKLLDFGLARPADGNSELTTPGTIAGTPLYMAPEQIDARQVDARADLYSLGCVLYRMLTGTTPISAPTPLATLSAIATQEPKSPSEVNREISDELSNLVMRLLGKAPADRPQSAGEVADEIARIQGTASQPVQPAETSASGSQWRSSTVAGAAILLLAAGVVLAAIIITIRHKDGSESAIELSGDGVQSIELEQDGKSLAKVNVKKDPEKPAAENRAVDEAEIQIGPPVAVAIKPITIEPEPLPFKPSEPLVPHALVAKPAPIDGVISWTIHSTNHRSFVTWYAVSPDGRYLASASRDLAIRIWDVESGHLVKLLLGHRYASRITSTVDPQTSMTVCWSPDGKSLASVSEESPLSLWDFATGRLLRELSCECANPTAMHWSPDGTRIFLMNGQPANVATVFDVESGTTAYEIGANSAAWSPDAKTLAAGTADGRVRFLEADTGKLLRTIRVHRGPVMRIGFTPDGRTLATGTYRKALESKEQEMALWNVATGECSRRREGRFFLAFSPDGTKLMTGGRPVKTWVTRTGEVLGAMRPFGDAPGATWLPDSQRILLGQSHAGNIPAIRDAVTGEDARIFGFGWRSWSANFQFSADGQSMFHSYDQIPVHNLTGMWQMRPLRLVAFAERCRSSSSWSPDSQHLISGTQIRSAGTGRLENDLPYEDPISPEATPIAISPDGRQVAKFRSGREVSITDLVSGKLNKKLLTDEFPAAAVNHAAWSPRGDQVAATCSGGDLVVWDLNSGKVARRVETSRKGWRRVDWSHDASWISVSIGNIYAIFDVESGEKQVGQNLKFITWMNQGSQYATYSLADRTVKIHDAETGRVVRALNAPAMISPDGKLMVGGEMHTHVYYSGKDGALLGKVHILKADHQAPNIKYMLISPEGHWHSPTPNTNGLFVYVVQTEQGQETLTAQEFAEKYGWRNDPEKAHIIEPAPALPSSDSPK